MFNVEIYINGYTFFDIPDMEIYTYNLFLQLGLCQPIEYKENDIL